MPITSRNPEPVDIKRELARYYQRYDRIGTYQRNSGNGNGLQSALFDPLRVVENLYGGLRTVDRYQNRSISCDTLRRVSTKCWIIQACILNVQKKVKPFLKPSTDRNVRGFVILKNGEDIAKASGKKSAEREKIEKFLLNTGVTYDPDREDNFVKYGSKIIRDLLEIDQISTEIQYTRGGDPFAFWAVDSATIEKVVPGIENPENIKYVQVVDHIPCAFYTKDELIFDFQNPRTDLRYSFYGYSYVEQAIDLITSVINAFTYNSGFFTENKLPRGMLLIDGDASVQTKEMMEDYLAEVMSGTPSSQWRVPVIPSGFQKGEGGQIKWVSLTSTNRDMEFTTWMDYLNSGVTAIFGATLEDLGIHSQKSQPIYENTREPIIKSTKSLVLGDVLSFLQSYLNRIIEKINSDYQIEFVGYERDDPKEVLGIDKGEVESYKTLNEKREEKGLKKLDAAWADIPMNPYTVQLYRDDQMGGGMAGMPGMEDMADMEGMEEDGPAPGMDGGKESWGDFGSGEEPAPEGGAEDGPPPMDFGKSLNKPGTIRITV
jgi:hypothetical protein